ncbi:MAG: glutamate-semialdehyde -aminomutase [Solirubrobacteraceae bacterium]|nr:glutamate-semialdehyde -aminomutase [Solirubrobacteraceae bacterium]
MNEISPERLASLRERELERFAELRPRGMRLLEDAAASMPNGVPTSWMATLYEHPPVVVRRGAGAGFTDVDGNAYLDFNLADTSMFTGHGVEAVTRAVAERVAAGVQFLLPTEDAVEVAGELGRRFGLPSWQFTLSATQANTEAIRVARAVTGRSAVLMFDGKYHGHADELLGELGDAGVAPEGLGVPRDATRHVRLVQYNDLDAVERELARGDVACILAEAAITNTGVILPAEGFHPALQRLASGNGTLLIRDETHTLVAGPGGLTGRWGLESDMVVVGKSISGGVPLGAYGMTAAVAGVLEHGPSASYGEGVATGGTLFGNALSLAAARATLTEVLTDDAYEHAASLGARLADGIEAVAAAHELPWRAHRLYNRSGYTHAPELPSNALEARATFDADLFNVQRLYMANRGVWEAIYSAGPACGIQTTDDDVDRYLGLLDGFLRSLL